MVHQLTSWHLDLDDLAKINRTWLCSDLQSLNLTTNAELAQPGNYLGRTQHVLSSIPTGGIYIFLILFCYHIDISYCYQLGYLCIISEKTRFILASPCVCVFLSYAWCTEHDEVSCFMQTIRTVKTLGINSVSHEVSVSWDCMVCSINMLMRCQSIFVRTFKSPVSMVV